MRMRHARLAGDARARPRRGRLGAGRGLGASSRPARGWTSGTARTAKAARWLQELGVGAPGERATSQLTLGRFDDWSSTRPRSGLNKPRSVSPTHGRPQGAAPSMPIRLVTNKNVVDLVYGSTTTAAGRRGQRASGAARRRRARGPGSPGSRLASDLDRPGATDARRCARRQARDNRDGHQRIAPDICRPVPAGGPSRPRARSTEPTAATPAGIPGPDRTRSAGQLGDVHHRRDRRARLRDAAERVDAGRSPRRGPPAARRRR